MTRTMITAHENMTKIHRRLEQFKNLNLAVDRWDPLDRWENMKHQVAHLEQILSDGLKDMSRMKKVNFRDSLVFTSVCH